MTTMMRVPDAEPAVPCFAGEVPDPALTEGLETVEPEEEDEGSLAEEFLSGTDCSCDLWLYRDRTVARLPSLLGREFFRTRVSSYRVGTFEDAVIFVHDVEKCLEELGRFDQELIAKVVLQDYTQDEAAQLMGMLAANYRAAFSGGAGPAERSFSGRRAAGSFAGGEFCAAGILSRGGNERKVAK
jgi:hypothetical protein